MPNHDVPCPDELSEFEIQAALARLIRKKARKLGLIKQVEIKGEVTVNVTGGKRIRLDLVVYVNKVAVVAIETKKSRSNIKTAKEQCEKYRDYLCIPVLLCVGMENISAVSMIVRHELNGRPDLANAIRRKQLPGNLINNLLMDCN